MRKFIFYLIILCTINTSIHSSSIKLKIYTDIVNTIHEAYRILSLGSNNNKKIKRAVKLSLLFHLSSLIAVFPKLAINLAGPIGPIRLFDEDYGLNEFRDPPNSYMPESKKEILFTSIYSVLPALSALLFMCKDGKILDDSIALTKYNAESNRNLVVEKTKQLIWLAFNKLSPIIVLKIAASSIDVERLKQQVEYPGDALSSMMDDMFGTRNPLHELLYEYRLVWAAESYLDKVFSIVKGIADISEIVRKYYRYKIEMGDYQNFNKAHNKSLPIQTKKFKKAR